MGETTRIASLILVGIVVIVITQRHPSSSISLLTEQLFVVQADFIAAAHKRFFHHVRRALFPVFHALCGRRRVGLSVLRGFHR